MCQAVAGESSNLVHGNIQRVLRLSVRFEFDLWRCQLQRTRRTAPLAQQLGQPQQVAKTCAASGSECH
jgi:hypothetical protein